MSIRRRHTFFLRFDDPDAVDQFTFSLGDKSASTTHFSAPREDRVSVPLSAALAKLQIPELKLLLDSVKTIQVKWSRPVSFNHNYPAAIVREPGLHVDIVPKNDSPIDADSLSSLLSTFFGVNFESQEFVNGPLWKSFYAKLDSLENFSTSLQDIICTSSDCSSQLKEVAFADSFSFSYGSLPHNARPHQEETDLVFELFWSDRTPISNALSIKESKISKIDPDEKVEIGLLAVHPDYTTENSIWGLAGFSRDLDVNKTEKLLFQYTTKHRTSTGKYYADFVRPTGLHPKHEIHASGVQPPRDGCSLFAKYSFDRSLFLDKYQLQDLAEATPNRPPIGSLYGVWGETDLEAPIWEAKGWGSEALVQLYTGPITSKLQLDFELPTHSRYGIPQRNSSLVHEYQPWPVVFWACKPIADDQDLEAKIPSAIETRITGYEDIFPEKTVFYYLEPTIPEHLASPSLYSEFDIPVAPFSAYPTVQMVSVVVIFASFFYLLYEVFRNFARYNKKPAVDATKKNI